LTEWQEVNLGQVVEILSSKRVFASDYTIEGVPFWRGKEVVELSAGRSITTELYIAEKTYQFLGRKIGFPKKDDILLTSVGTLGRAYKLTDEDRIYFKDGNLTWFRNYSERLDPSWLLYWMRSDIGQGSFEQTKIGSTQQALTIVNLKSLKVALPPLLEQRAIAATLGALDDKIELNRRMNETLEAMARALFRDWFVDFGPTRAKMAGNAPYLSPDLWFLFPDSLDDAGKPEGWGFEPVIDQADWINGAAYKNMHFSDAPDALPVIKIAELKNGVTGNTAWTATDLGSRYLINDGELLFSWSGNPDTSIDTFLWSGGKAWLNQHIFAVRESGKRSKPFLHAMLKFLKPDFAELARNKQTTGLGHVTKADMQRMLICTASEAVHQAFDKLVTPIFDRAFLLQTESRTLAQTRDLLLPRLMSGELRVAELALTERETAA
jgi:type I restriction enzyme S subunit